MTTSGVPTVTSAPLDTGPGADCNAGRHTKQPVAITNGSEQCRRSLRPAEAYEPELSLQTVDDADGGCASGQRRTRWGPPLSGVSC